MGGWNDSFQYCNNNKILYAYHKANNNKKIVELRCKDRLNCKGRAIYNVEDGVINITQNCTLKYEEHNYSKNIIIQNKIRNKTATLEEMKEKIFQKYYFIESFMNYPTLNYNEIAINLVNNYEIEKILFTNAEFSKFKNEYYKKKYFNQDINERIENIKLFNKKLLYANIGYKDKDEDIYKHIRIYATEKSISLLNNGDINQYFIDTTYKCLPKDIEDSKSLLVLIGYNNKKDIFELILVSIMSHEDADIFKTFYNFIIGAYKWKPKYITFDFGSANLKAVKEIFVKEQDIIYITCLFHLLQCWWRKAGSIGLRKKNYIKDTKLMLFNFELLPFLEIDEARDFYNAVLKIIPKDEKFAEFIEYFEETWFPINEECSTKYDFDLWSYVNKFEFVGNKKELSYSSGYNPQWKMAC